MRRLCSRVPDVDHDRLSPCIIGRLSGFVSYRWETIVSSGDDQSPGWRKILHLLWRNVSSLFFLRAIGYLMIEKTYKVAIRDAGAYFYKRLVSKNAKLKDLAHIFYYHLTRFPYFWRDGSRAKRIFELIELLCFDRSKRTRHVLFSLPFYLYSLISLIFFPSPPPKNHSLSINIPNRDDRFFYSLNVRHVTNGILRRSE